MRATPDSASLPAVPIARWLSAKQLAGEFGLSVGAAYRWRRELLPPDFILFAGTQRVRFHPAAVTWLRARFAAAHGEDV